jgi:hypothetical protein
MGTKRAGMKEKNREDFMGNGTAFPIEAKRNTRKLSDSQMDMPKR